MNAPVSIPAFGLRLEMAGACLLSLALVASRAIADEEPDVVLTRPVAWTNVFGGQEIKTRVTVRAKNRTTGRLLWSLASTDRLGIARGELPAEVVADEAKELEITLPLPPVKPGVILPLLLTVTLLRDGDREAVARLETPLWVFPEDPFFDRQKWLAELKLTLYDPPGKTAERLTAAKIPFEQVHNVAALEELAAGTLLVGEGVSLREERALPALLLALARRGVSVLCLAPIDGALLIPTRGDGSQPPAIRLHWQRQEMVRQLDKRLDAEFWMTERAAPTHSLDLAADGGQVVAQVADDAQGWSWVEMQFPGRAAADSPIRLVVTTLPLIQHWESGPTPRFLLARILEHLAPENSPSPPLAATKETVSP